MCEVAAAREHAWGVASEGVNCRLFCAGMRAGVQDFNVINLGDLEVKFSEGDEVSLETLQVCTCVCCTLWVHRCVPFCAAAEIAAEAALPVESNGHTWYCSYVLSCTKRALTCCVCCAVQEKRVLNLSGRLAKLPLKVCGRQDTQAHVRADDEHLKFILHSEGRAPVQKPSSPLTT